jgi:hypothetical protein
MHKRKEELFNLWQKVKSLRSVYYVVEEQGLVPETQKIVQKTMVLWDEVEQLFDDAILQIENESKTIKKNSSN